MQVKQVVVDEGDGTLLVDEKDGFIIQGNIYVSKVNEKGLPTGGLIGSGEWLKQAKEGKAEIASIPMTALSKKNFIMSLGFTAEELVEMSKFLSPKPRKVEKDKPE